MSYLDQSHRASPGSMAAVIGIHAGIGALLVFGLTVAGGVIERDAPVPSFDLKDEVPPPPPPEIEPQPQPDAATPQTPPINVPRPPLDLVPVQPRIDTTDLILPPMPTPTRQAERVLPGPVVPPTVPKVDPVAAKPRNDPARWVTTDDYRSNWINREMTGTARFRLEIAANGSVRNCSITGSTGHSALDQATCDLVSRRARFQPARGADGEPVAGTYDSAVRWVVPE